MQLKSLAFAASLAILSAFSLGPALALPSVGAPAPQFNATLTDGNPVSLSDFAGKLVVLEWTNKDCPFVHKHYASGNMQAVQAAIAKQGGAWISIISSAPGREGHVTAAQANQVAKDEGAKINGIILDESGTIGRLYGATATPHMFVIDSLQTLRYMGAIDDHTSASPESLKGANNYVLAAVSAIKSGNDVAVKETAPYGCSVKY